MLLLKTWSCHSPTFQWWIMGAAPLTGLLEEQEIVPVNTPVNLQRAAVSAIFTGPQRASSCKSEDLELGGVPYLPVTQK